MDDRGKIFFKFDRIEADLLGFKVPLPKINSDEGFVEVQVISRIPPPPKINK